MKPTPKGWPRISSALVYQDPARAIDWLCKAFGFEVRLKVEGDGGAIVHSELTFGEGLIMVAGETPAGLRVLARSPRSLGGANTQSLCVYVDDAEAHHAGRSPRAPRSPARCRSPTTAKPTGRIATTRQRISRGTPGTSRSASVTPRAERSPE